MTTLRMAYAGQRLTRKDTLAQAWVPVEGDDREVRVYSGKGLVKYAGIGTIYVFTINDEGSVFTGGQHAPKRALDDGSAAAWVDQADRLAWEAADREALREHEALSLRKREKDVSLLREALLPLRVAMASKSRQVSRSALVQAVTEELWRPLTQAERDEAGLPPRTRRS